jgi:hypothetical protein
MDRAMTDDEKAALEEVLRAACRPRESKEAEINRSTFVVTIKIEFQGLPTVPDAGFTRLR